jgi:hypothetical protein
VFNLWKSVAGLAIPNSRGQIRPSCLERRTVRLTREIARDCPGNRLPGISLIITEGRTRINFKTEHFILRGNLQVDAGEGQPQRPREFDAPFRECGREFDNL